MKIETLGINIQMIQKFRLKAPKQDVVGCSEGWLESPGSSSFGREVLEVERRQSRHFWDLRDLFWCGSDLKRDDSVLCFDKYFNSNLMFADIKLKHFKQCRAAPHLHFVGLWSSGARHVRLEIQAAVRLWRTPVCPSWQTVLVDQAAKHTDTHSAAVALTRLK